MAKRQTALAAAALLLAALAGSVGAAPVDEATRQHFTDWYACGFFAAAFQKAAEVDPVSAEDSALAERGMAAMKQAADYFDTHEGPQIDPADFEAIRTQTRDKLSARMAAFKGQPDAAQKVRDDFRADLQACVAKADALVAPKGN
jgi:hypothetical protein